jgi:Plasmid encoded RepA protein
MEFHTEHVLELYFYIVKAALYGHEAAKLSSDAPCQIGWNAWGLPGEAKQPRHFANRQPESRLVISSWAAGRIVSSGLRFNQTCGDGQGNLWEDRVVLDEAFYRALQDHPVPLQETAIRELRERSMSLDIYVWLAWRLHSLTKRTPISWLALHGQFGSGYAKVFHFKPRFLEALAAALAAYPQAKVNVDETRVVLHPSRPPISRLDPRTLSIA